MYRLMLKKDLKRNKTTLIILFIFILISSMLTASGISLLINLNSAIDEFMVQAKTPHFIQMHQGELDEARLEQFAQTNEFVSEFQNINLLNVESSRIYIEQQSLSESTQDNAFVTQNKMFDYLLDLKGEIISPKKGEVYVPIFYMQQYDAQVGDTLTIVSDQKILTYTIAGYLRDSQMNPSMSSSKRFLVNEEDLIEIASVTGTNEYIIEFRLKDVNDCSAFETAYMSAGLEANGPTLTFPLVKMVNALSDGIIFCVLILVSILSIIIAFLCIRFTLIAAIEEDYREIGIMKAIGVQSRAIKKMYLGKYILITVIGCVMGYFLSFILSGILESNIRLYMGESNNQILCAIVSIMGSIIIYYTISLFVKSILKRLEKISPVVAMRCGMDIDEKTSSINRLSITKYSWLNTNVLIGIKDILARKKIYSTLMIVFTLAIFIMVVPINLYTTLSSEKFITYLGVGEYDMRIDLQQLEGMPDKVNRIKEYIEGDTLVEQSEVFVTSSYNVLTTDGTYRNMKIEIGNHNIFPVSYIDGIPPQNDNEIALSDINARELEKQLGDSLTIIVDGKEKNMQICGIYQDITNGGKTVKATFTSKDHTAMWYVIGINFVEGTNIQEKVNEYREAFDYGKINGIEEYVDQTLNVMLKSMQIASISCSILAIIIAGAITLLFMRMLIVKDYYSIAIMKAIGLKNEDISIQYIARSVFIMLIGIILGTILANTLGTKIAGIILSNIGISHFIVFINPLIAYIVCPVILIVDIIVATLRITKSVGNVNIVNYITE